MKLVSRHLRSALLLAAVMLSALGMQSAIAAPGTIIAGKHDFSTSGPNATYKSATQTQVCIYCHAPHNNASIAAPLWNHAQSVATYTLYTSAISTTLNATTGQPGVTSKLCLSCHDGTVAVDSFGGATGTKMATGTALLGTDLSNDHPIGFTYDAALATSDGGLKNPAVATVTLGTTGVAGSIETKMLFGGKMECASCHDVHNGTARTAVESKLVTLTTTGSTLCLACHNK